MSKYEELDGADKFVNAFEDPALEPILAEISPCVRLVVASNEFNLRDSNNNEISIFRRIYRAGAG